MTLLERLRELHVVQPDHEPDFVEVLSEDWFALLAAVEAAQDAERILFDWAKEFPGLVTPWERLSKAIAPLTTEDTPNA